MRAAIGNHIRRGERLTDEHITSERDVRAVIGAIKSGHVKPEDAPPSVRQIMDDMRARGIDPAKAEPRQVEQYFRDNPKALEAAKQINRQDDHRAAGESHDQRQVVTESRVVAAAPPAPAAQRATPATATL